MRVVILLTAALAANVAQAQDVVPGMVRCANLTYGNGKTSVCFSQEFLKQISRDTNVVTEEKFSAVKLESTELFDHPFAIMTGEGGFTLTSVQHENLRNYLYAGGFVVASAGCSDKAWVKSFRAAIAQTFPELKLKRIPMSHPLFHTVYDISRLDCKRGTDAHLEGLEVDGKIVLIFSPDGLNDTGKVGGKCCCCGGNEIKNARQINVNLLAYTLTH